MLIDRVKQIVSNTAKAANATATVEVPYSSHYPVTYNDPELTASMLPSLQNAVGAENVSTIPPKTGAEDFSFFGKKVPALFFNLGGMPKGQNANTTPSHHTPDFYIDEAAMKYGIMAFLNLINDYTTLYQQGKAVKKQL